jgi:hypothetical protein
MSNIYLDGTYLDNNPDWHEQDSLWKAENIIRILRGNSVLPNTIAEVGCGAGGIIYTLANKYPGIQFKGYELSPQAYQLCCSKPELDNLEFYNTDIIGQDEDFDLILCVDVFEHVEDCFEFIRSLKKISQNIIFHIPLDLSVQKLLRGYPLIRARRQLGHIHYFTKDLAVDLLEDCGCKVMDHFYTNSLDLPGQRWPTKLARCFIKFAFKFNKDFTVRVLGGYSFLVLSE